MNLPNLDFPGFTALGAMGRYISTPNTRFQPMNCAFGLIDPLPAEPGKRRIRNKAERYEAIAARALEYWSRMSKTVKEGVTEES